MAHSLQESSERRRAPDAADVNLHSFVADTATEAVEQIRAQLGPEAVALHVRPIPAPGMARLWRKPKIEVLAYVPEPEPVSPPNEDPIGELRQELEQIRSRLAAPVPAEPGNDDLGRWAPDSETRPDADGWHLISLLQGVGLFPRFAQQIKDEVCHEQGDRPPGSVREELAFGMKTLTGHWRTGVGRRETTAHIFIGAPGVGKSTLLCKCLARRVLVEGKAARVLQLDGRTANPNGLVNLYGEILGVPVDRLYRGAPPPESDELLFVDLPGIDSSDREALNELGQKLQLFTHAETHLVLNGAYETATLLQQARAFLPLPITDLSVTHLDEEKKRGKLWNLVLGTNYSVRWLSAGQNIPGDLREAAVENLLWCQTLANKGF